MSSQAHTPGPWVVAESDTREGRAVFADAGISGVAQVAIVPRELAAHHKNAHLIAAAPDLLAAARSLIECKRHGWPSSGALNALELAIAKATQG